MRKRANAFSDKAKNSVGVVYRPLHELKLDPNNPRVHSPRQVRQIAQYRSFRLQCPGVGGH
jgi:hypothetical protein